MARLSVGVPTGATNITPKGSTLNRPAQDGTQKIIQLLLGSNFKINLEGDYYEATTGSIVGGTVQVDTDDSRLKVTGAGAALGSYATQVFRFDDKVYMYPGTRLRVNQKMPTATPNDTVRVSFKLIDDSTDDKLYMELQGEAAGSKQQLRQEIDGTQSHLYSGTFGALTEISWEYRHKDQGMSKLYLDDSLDGNYNKVWTGTVGADLRTCKAEFALETQDNVSREVSSDFIFAFYPNFTADYDIDDDDKFKGDCKTFDTLGESNSDDWIQVYSPDHVFTGNRVIQNGHIRIIFNGIDIDVYAYADGAYTYTHRVRYRDKKNAVATSLFDVVFRRLTTSQIALTIKYNNGDAAVDLRRGNPYARLTMAKYIEVNTSKSRMCIPGTIQYYRQNKCHDEGNPLVIGSNPYTFTNDTNADTGIQLMDSRYIGLFDQAANDKAGFVSFLKRPTSMQVDATSSTDLGTITAGFALPASLGVGVLVANFNVDTSSNSRVDGISEDSANDTYFKYRADESQYSFRQKHSVKKRR